MTSLVGTHGQGSIVAITNRQGNPRLRVAVTMADGRRVYRTARTPRQAESIRRQLVEARELDLDPSRQTVAVFLRSWIGSLRDAKHSRVRPRTLDHYALIVERHIVPALGSVRLSALTARKVQAWLDTDAAAPRTVHHHRAVLRRALNVAVRQRMIPWNPATAVELPKVTTDAADPLTLDEVKALLEATRDDRLGPLWRLAIVTGLREAELLGLTWEDLDLGRAVDRTVGADAPSPDVSQFGASDRDAALLRGAHLTVRSQLQRRNGQWVRTPPKSARAVQVIAIDDVTAAVLERHRLRMAEERTPDWTYFGLMFLTSRGLPYHGSEILKAFRVALRRAGVRERRFHDLRHSSARLLKDAGVQEDVRQARLGHSTTAMSRKYGGASEAMDREAADRVARRLG